MFVVHEVEVILVTDGLVLVVSVIAKGFLEHAVDYD